MVTKSSLPLYLSIIISKRELLNGNWLNYVKTYVYLLSNTVTYSTHKNIFFTLFK